jgi:hypothetical protein
MTRQPNLFDPMCATVRTQQPKLWADGPRESSLTCECGEPLLATQSGFLCCPLGHGRLFEAANDPKNWQFDEDGLYE